MIYIGFAVGAYLATMHRSTCDFIPSVPESMSLYCTVYASCIIDISVYTIYNILLNAQLKMQISTYIAITITIFEVIMRITNTNDV